MILDDDEEDETGTGNKAKGTSDIVQTVHIEGEAGPLNTLVTSELASGLTKSIDASGLWYDVEKGCYVEELAPGLGPCEQQGVPSTSAQAQPQTLPQSSTPLQDQTNRQGVDSITRSTSVEPAVYSLSDSGDDGWTVDSMAEFEKELGLVLIEQGNSSSASAPTSLRPRSIEASQDEIQNREHTETTGSRPEELQEVSRHGTAQGFEEWEQRETEVVVERGDVATRQQEELAARKEELGQPTVGGDQQDLAVVVDTDDFKDMEATEALPATQSEIPEIDERRFQLRGIRTLLFARRPKRIQYRVVWGEHPNRSGSWMNEDDIRISVLRPPCEPSSQNLAPQVERNMRVYRMRKNKCSKGKKIYEYLVDESRTWITEDQLRISLSPVLVAELKGN